MAKVPVGLVKGLSRVYLEDWVDNLPKQLGEKVGEILLGSISDSKPLGEPALAKFEAWLNEDSARGGELTGLLLATAGDETQNVNSLLPDYAGVLNMITTAARKQGRPVVVRGFLH